jgi:hypothetical protein
MLLAKWNRGLSRRAAIGAAALGVAAIVAATAGATHASGACAGLNSKALVAKAAKVVGSDTVAQLDAGHANECDYFSSTTGREVRIYTWPKAQQMSAVAEILSGYFAGHAVKKTPLSGLGPGALSYNGDPGFVAGSKFVFFFPYNLTNAQTLSVARLVHTALG